MSNDEYRTRLGAFYTARGGNDTFWGLSDDPCRLVRQVKKIARLDEEGPRLTRPLPACSQVKEIFRLLLLGPATKLDNLVHLPDERQGSCTWPLPV